MEGSEGGRGTQQNQEKKKNPNMKRLIIKLASFFSLPTEMEVTWKSEINVAMLSSLCTVCIPRGLI